MKKTPMRAARLLTGAIALAAPLTLTAQPAVAAQAAAATVPSFSGVVKAAQPAVVTVRISGREMASMEGEAQPDMAPQMREFFERFFGDEMPPMMPPGGGQTRGVGSGFIVDPKGVIVTNNHVVDGAKKVTVVLDDGTELKAEVVGTDDKTDLAVLKVDAGRDLPFVEWGDSDGVDVGDWAIAIGNPFGLGGSVSAGIISARGRNINSGPYDDYLQIDAPINRGNSGGPLFNQQGLVIGVNTAIFSPSGGNVGIGFAIPANQAETIVADLLDDGTVERGWLGVSIQQVTPAIAESIGLEEAAGAMIAEVNEDGPAEESGLKRGDVILDFAGTKIKDLRDLTGAVAATAPGETAKVRVLRKGEEMTLDVKTGKYPA